MSPSQRDRVTAGAALAAMAVHGVIGPHVPHAQVIRWAAAGVAIIILIASRRASAPVRGLAAMAVSLAIGTRLPVPWQASMLAALIGFVAIGRLFPSLHASGTWRARGSIPVGWTVLVGGVTPPALLAWLFVMHPDLHDVVRANVPDVPFPLLVAGAIGFVAVNAALEELIWRGVIQDHLEPVFGSRGSIALQALSFGLQHTWGVPRGLIGVVLAGSWAVMLGLLRHHSRGLLAPFLAHSVADATIAVMILSFAR